MKHNEQFRNLIWNFIGTTVNACMSLVYQIIVTRINGLEATGTFSVCFSFSLLIYTFTNLGGRVFEVADKNGNDNTYYTLKWLTAMISLVFSVSFSRIARYSYEKTMLIILLMLVRIVESFSDTIYALWQKADRLDLVGISYVSKNIVSVVAFLWIDHTSGDLLLSTIAMFAATLVVFVFFDWRGLKRFELIRIDANFKDCLSLARRMWYFIGFNLVTMLIANVPKLLADQRYSITQMGYFGILMMIPSVMILLGQIVVQQNLMTFTNLYHEGKYKELRSLLENILRNLTVMAILCCIAAYILGTPILNFVYGLDFRQYRISMVLLVIAGTFNVFTMLVSSILTVMGKSMQQLYLYFLTMVMEIIVLAVGISAKKLGSVFVIYGIVMAVQCLAFILYFYGMMGSKYEIQGEHNRSGL